MAGPLQSFMFRITAEKTGEAVSFSGQGTTIEEAWKWAVANIKSPFRPSSSGGRPNRPLDLTVSLPAGGVVHRSKEDFESGNPWRPAT